MATIWKYKLNTVDQQFVDMPAAAEILCVQSQDDDICVWAEVEPAPGMEQTHEFFIHGTGHRFSHADDGAKYIGSVQTHGGRIVWHVYHKITRVTKTKKEG